MFQDQFIDESELMLLKKQQHQHYFLQT